jgi:hypothetical protein
VNATPERGDISRVSVPSEPAMFAPDIPPLYDTTSGGRRSAFGIVLRRYIAELPYGPTSSSSNERSGL